MESKMSIFSPLLICNRFHQKGFIKKLPVVSPLFCFLIVGMFSLWTATAWAQIGGKTAADGPFTIDNAEDLNVRSETLGRDWVSDIVKGQQVLSAIPPGTDSLTLMAGQSPNGVLKGRVPVDNFGSISGGYGIPMPSQVGASTLDFPGNITSFSYLNFLTCYQPAGLANQKFQILLECYPQNGDSTFPTVIWNYTPQTGKTFRWIGIPLNSPSGIVNNPGAKTLPELLSKTRFIYFLYFASPVASGTTFSAWVDDLKLDTTLPQTVNATPEGEWVYYE
jgi:hypothetical protein